MFDLVKNFPESYTPTLQQRRVLSRVQEALNGPNKYVLISAPTGTGKSMISRAIGNSTPEPDAEWKQLVEKNLLYKQNHRGEHSSADDSYECPPFGAYVLTITKNLQNQYKELFTDSAILKGKSNYMCEIDNTLDVEVAPCALLPNLRVGCCNDKICHYYNARDETAISKFSVLNYKMFFSLPPHVRRRNVIICDEASELEEELVKRFSVVVDYSILDKLKVSYSKLIDVDRRNVSNWISEVVGSLSEVRDSLLSKNNKKQITDQSRRDKNKLTQLNRVYNSLLTIHAHWFDSEFIVEKDARSVTLTPLKVNHLSDTIFKHGDKIVLMSATVVDCKKFAETLGIGKYSFIEVGCEFDSSKSPIYVSSKTKLNHRNLHQEMPKVASQIMQILDMHKDVKGVIHTHTNNITGMIGELIDSDRLLYRNISATNEDILDEHKNAAEPTVLVSPSLTYGVDLKDSLARFQIIVKLPYLPLGSKRIKTLFDMDKKWYENKMLVNLMQACGRGTRGVDDFCSTYILDGNVVRVLQSNKDRLPKHFLDRFV